MIHLRFLAGFLLLAFLTACAVPAAQQPALTPSLPAGEIQTLIPASTVTHLPAPSATSAPIQTLPAVATPAPSVTSTLSSTPQAGLRSLAEPRDLWLGAAVDSDALAKDALYAAVLAREFNEVTPENVMKFETIHPARERYDFSAADALVQFAAAHGMRVRGHTLVWHSQLPAWVTDGHFSRDELIAILKDHITTVVSHYRGQVAAWDVVNEAFNDDGTLRETVWSKGIGPEYIDMAFQWAHAADPAALLFYNDYNNEYLNRKSDSVYTLAQDLLKRGVPIHGVGLQMHATLNPHGAVSPDLGANLQRLGSLGLKVHITELDIRLPQPASAANLADQAAQYGGMLSACLQAPACQAFVLWGFSDRYSWIPKFFQGYGQALIFDDNFQPKPAYQALADALKRASP